MIAYVGTIYLIRHGQASLGSTNYDILSPIGVRQSEILGTHLNTLGYAFSHCFSGQLQRQKDTAKIVLAQMQYASCPPPVPIIAPAFDEFDADALIHTLLPQVLAKEPHALTVMQNIKEHRNEFLRLFTRLMEGWINEEYDIGSLETWSAFTERTYSGFTRILETANPDDQIAIFTSAGVISALLQRILAISPLKALELNWQIINTSFNRLKYRSDALTLASFNGQEHLELLKNPELITYR